MKKEDEHYYEFKNRLADLRKLILDVPDEFFQPPPKKFVLKQSVEEMKINNFSTIVFMVFSVFAIVYMLVNDQFDKYIFGFAVIMFVLCLLYLSYSYLNTKKALVEFVDGTFEIKGKVYHYSDDLRLIINDLEDLKIMSGEKELIKISIICEGRYEMVRWMRYYHVPIIDITKEEVKKCKKRAQKKEIISLIVAIIGIILLIIIGHI